MDEVPGGSFTLVEALAADLRAKLRAAAPIVVYAWTRRVPSAAESRTIMYAKLFYAHRSQIVEATGLDNEHAYHRLVERAVAWVDEQRPVDGREPR
jgi:hypothetical protein